MRNKLEALRAKLREMSLKGFIIPNNDEFQNEYLPASAKRLEWLTGFTGSAGTAVITEDSAAFFTDGRYTLQASAQLDSAVFTIYNTAETPLHKWLSGKSRIGVSPSLHTQAEIERFRNAGAEIVFAPENPIDALWQDRPLPPASAIRPQPLEYAGESAESKISRVAAILAGEKIDLAVIATADSTNWLFNIRGNDIEYTPFALSYATVSASGKARLYAHSPAPGIETRPLSALANDLAASGGKRVLLDFSASPAGFLEILHEAKAEIVNKPDPCQLLKACKNPVELAGIRKAHELDGKAVAKFLSWLAAEAPKGKLTEIAAADRLEEFRRENTEYLGPSFATISGAGPNGAIVHYHSTPETNRTLEPGSLYLIDSGGQYAFGTTDITRTVAIGEPTPEMRRDYTLVLKGHIALAMARFPTGTTGSQLDSLARYPLWRHGMDYDHGTGHGVGHYLSVHEGPQRISKTPSSVALQPGMVLSNEPGYYKTGHYGIRIENLVAVTPSSPGFLEFETLTKAPLDLNLVDFQMLGREEESWLRNYQKMSQ